MAVAVPWPCACRSREPFSATVDPDTKESEWDPWGALPARRVPEQEDLLFPDPWSIREGAWSSLPAPLVPVVMELLASRRPWRTRVSARKDTQVR